MRDRETYVTTIGHEARLERLRFQLRDTKAARNQAILDAHMAGLPLSRIARAVGLTKGRVGQITLRAKKGLDMALEGV